MPHEKKVTIYTFDELSDKAKDVARNWYREGALDYEWWDSIYEDAARVGLEITSFDADRGNSITGDFTRGSENCAELILKEHGKDTDTYKLAAEFLPERQALQTEFDSDDDDNEDRRSTRVIDGAIVDLEDEFKRAVLEEYLSMLKQEVEYMMEDEQVDESIRANEYEFLSNGKRA